MMGKRKGYGEKDDHVDEYTTAYVNFVNEWINGKYPHLYICPRILAQISFQQVSCFTYVVFQSQEVDICLIECSHFVHIYITRVNHAVFVEFSTK